MRLARQTIYSLLRLRDVVQETTAPRITALLDMVCILLNYFQSIIRHVAVKSGVEYV